MRRLRKWYCIQTNYRQEFMAEKNLERAGYVVFLPLHPVQYKSGVKLEPVFPTYLFVSWVSDQSWHPIMGMPGVKGFLQITQVKGSKPQHIPLGAVEELKKLHDYNNEIPAGTRVEVLSGYAKGMRGTTLLSDRERTLVLFDFARHGLTSKLYERLHVKRA